MKHYDILIVGAGIAGAMCAHKALSEGKTCLVIDRNPFIGGFCYTENINGIDVHKYGAHIFRTHSRKVWDFVNSITPFTPFVNSPIAKYRDEVYNLPFNMNTFHQLFGVTTPSEAAKAIDNDRVHFENPQNLEEHILSVAGRAVYEKLVKEYTEKQWGKPCAELPISIMRRIPLRMTYDNNYYPEKFQGIPVLGYTSFIERLLKGADINLGVDYFENESKYDQVADHTIFTGRIDEYFGYKFGELEYNRVGFIHIHYPTDNFQGNAVVNYTDAKIPYTRSIEHKHFTGVDAHGTIVSYEFPLGAKYPIGNEPPSYPIDDERNNTIYAKYLELTKSLSDKVTFFGRLAEYRYYSMNDIIEKFI